MYRYNNANCAGTRFYRCLIHMHAIGVSNPNVPIFPPRVCTLVLFIIIITCICVQWVAMVFLVYRAGMQLPLVAMVLREASRSALMRISSNN